MRNMGLMVTKRNTDSCHLSTAASAGTYPNEGRTSNSSNATRTGNAYMKAEATTSAALSHHRPVLFALCRTRRWIVPSTSIRT